MTGEETHNGGVQGPCGLGDDNDSDDDQDMQTADSLGISVNK